MFKTRSTKYELLDGEVEKDDLILNLKELHAINSLLGGYAVSLRALKHVNAAGKVLVDIGSGGGDMLNEIRSFSKKKDLNLALYGVDLKQECTAYATSHLPADLTFITDDYKNVLKHVKKVDILHACLFTHHLTEEQLIDLLKFSKENGFTLIINDLHRHPLAYYSIKLLTRLISKSKLVKHDAPLSVLRGFKKKEWLSMLSKAEINKFTLQWKWAFRHQLIVYG
jgi:2-polyprenyl-3-methyl-5-hydroxy-6-metoxy-1,4-benzoquinol methylase